MDLWPWRGYQVDDVDALLHRLADELGERSRQLAEVRAENRRIKNALRSWQSAEAELRQAGPPKVAENAPGTLPSRQ